MVAQNTPSSYDQIPYPGLSYSRTHPDSLATMATLLGMSPAPVDRCRVLELGCAVGGNLLPMAYTLPQSEFVGVDASAAQIAEGRATAAALGLGNVTLKHLDILDVDTDLGQFDYIVAHGVYSWVSDRVREKILEICKHNLAANGVSYVSYNTYPGWHMINIVRGLMLFSTRNITDPQARVEQARTVLGILADARPDESDAYGSFLRMYTQMLNGKLQGVRHRSDALLLHDEMEEINEPVYFCDFAERAARQGLQYLADFHHMGGGELQPQTIQALKSMATSLIDLEQYLDFVQNRTFRQTLLCHQGIVIDRTLEPLRVKRFKLASRAQPLEPQPDIRSASVTKFRGHDGAILSTDHPVTKAAMLLLAEIWPQPMSFDQLLSEARQRAQRVGAQVDKEEIDAQVLGANALTAYGYSDSLVELHTHVPPIAVDVGRRPLASAVARLQAESSERVTNLRHERVTLDGFERYLLCHLNGRHDREDLLDLLLAGPVVEGTLTVQADGEPHQDLRALLAEEMESRLAWLAHAALLVGS